MGRKLLYGFATTGLFYLSVLYRSQALLAVCGVAVLFPLFFVCVLYSIRGKLEIELLFSSYPMEQRILARFIFPDFRRKFKCKIWQMARNSGSR